MKVLVVTTLPFAVLSFLTLFSVAGVAHGQTQHRINATNLNDESLLDVTSLRSLRKKQIVNTAPACAYASENDENVQLTDLVHLCVRSSPNQCGKQVRMLPYDGATCDAFKDEVQVTFSATGEFFRVRERATHTTFLLLWLSLTNKPCRRLHSVHLFLYFVRSPRRGWTPR